MKNKMPLDGIGLGHDSGSVHCDMLKMLCFRTAWGGGVNNFLNCYRARGDRYIDSLSLIVNNATTSPNYISHQCLQRHTAWREQATWSPRTFTSHRRSIFHRPKG